MTGASAAALVVVLLAVVVHGSRGPVFLDLPLAAAAQALWPRPGTGALLVDSIAAPANAVVIVVLLTLVCALLGRRRLAAVAAVGPLAAAAATILLKPLVGRSIHGDNLAYPSGHAAFASALALLLGLLFLALVRVGRAAAGFVLVVAVLALGGVMVVDQVVLGAHYPTDALGGLATGVVVLSTTALVVDALPGIPRSQLTRGSGGTLT